LLLLALGIVAPVVLAADIVVVSQKNRRFNPDQLAVPKGTTVRVMNDDRVTHHLYVDSPELTYDSGEQPVGKSIDLQFDKSGRFTVRCAIHPTMRLEMTVQ
jgi:plastocyanin